MQVTVDGQGLLTFYDHFDANNLWLGRDVEIIGGPHPLATNFDLYCETMVDALGL